jgi:hypothetical protein
MERANGTSQRPWSLRNAARAAEAALALLLAVLVSLPWPSVVVAQDEAQGDAQSATFSPEQLEQVVAPIALYPDSLLAQVMMASTYPLEIVEAARWAKEHPGLKDKALDDALQSQTWDASVKSLVAFPQVLTMMNDELAWTQKLGDAFLAQQSDVMYAVQVLRSKAKAQGNLESGEQQRVIVEPAPQGETTVIRIEPASPQVVYVPTYNPTVVYGSWPYPSYPPYSYYPPGYTAAASVLSFGVGMAVGSALWGGYNWGGGYGHGYGHGYGGNVDIDVNRYNNYSNNVTRNYDRNSVNNKFQDGKWQHDGSHRKGVQYRDKGVQNKYGQGNRGNVQSREAFRGRAEQGRQQMARDGGAGARKDLGKQGGAAGFGNQGGAGQRDRAGAAQKDRAPAGNRAGAAQRDRAAASNRGGGDRRSPSAFGGQGSGQQVRRDSSRGQASQQSARASSSRGGSQGGMRSGGGGGGGSRGGGGGSRGGGGGSRGGGGGGGGGGGRGGGGGGRGR